MENPDVLQETVQPSSKPNTQSSNEDGADPAPRKPGSKAQGRKRTKTGCLTCRKRRIKCGEERPTCQNCTKSKRHCEGYNQRVVFKDPLSAYRPSFSTSSHTAIPRPGTVQQGVRHGEVYPQPTSAQIPLSLAPKPQGAFGPSKAVDLPPLPAATSPGSERRVYNFSDIKGPATKNKHPQPPFDIQTDTVDRSHVPDPRPKHSPRDQATHYDFNALVKQEDREDPPITPAQISPLDWSAGPSSGSLSHPQELFHDSNRQFAAALPVYQTYPTRSTWEPITTPASVSQSFPALVQHELPSIAKVHGLQKPSEGPNGEREAPSQGWQSNQPNIYNFPPHATDWTTTQSAPLEEDPSAIVEDENDPFDVSDEDTTMEQQEESSGAWQEDIQDDHLRNNDLGIVVALQARQDTQDLSLRSFTSFIDRPDMLATYMPTPQSTPLKDPMTARIFCHFVNVTGPCISLFERHPANPSLIFQGVPVPKSQQNIWAYTFPTLALQNPALLHSILALGALHIAKLQDGPIAASLKHYAIGLRRVAKSVSIYSRRRQPATLAAAMLLAFYECWSADHQKWSNHILGAKQLVKEIDFAGMTRYIKHKKAEQRREEGLRYQQSQTQAGPDDRARFQPNIDELDENIVSMLMGKKLFYDRYGQIIEDSNPGNSWSKEYSERDLQTYETQRDLFWWYCKQDVYQSILGGGRLFMEYSLWSHCPPRSPLGRLTATYGTFDHLILLMGRLADFAAKDLKRKRLAMKANGGQWRPPPEYMQMQAQAAQASGSQTFPQTPPKQPQMPAFSGMLPGVQEAQLPMGFESSREDSPRSTQSDEMDLQARTQEAEEEWQEIRNAFGVLEDYFGEDFQALGPEFSEPMDTPFGPALKYRTYAIAGIWMNFYMGLIACHRTHPSMPPAAMMAAGIAARQTASFANELGRIAAGIAPDCSLTTQVNPTVGAALIESSTCLFVSGVQYQNAAQREWTVRRLRDIGRLTGWQTAYAIAAGCETSWVKTAELGKGPPYNKTFEENVVPELWISSRRIDRALLGLSADERRLVIERSDRVHYALGVLSIEEDFENLDLDGEESQTHPM